MNTCKKIEPLLYLFRELELSDDERTQVAEHCRTCSACRDILSQLTRVDGTLADVRKESPRLADEARTVAETLRQISGSETKDSRGERSAQMEEFVGWLRPIFATLLIFASMVLMVQLSRDALKIHRLETQLEAAGSGQALIPDRQQAAAFDLLELVNLISERRSPFSPPPENARAAGQSFGPVVQDVLNKQGSFFDKLSQRYPALSGINPQDGLDERERAILASDGKNFIKEFELFLSKGADTL